MKSRRKKKPLKHEIDDGTPFGWYQRLLDLGLAKMPPTLFDTEPLKINEDNQPTYFYRPQNQKS